MTKLKLTFLFLLFSLASWAQKKEVPSKAEDTLVLIKTEKRLSWAQKDSVRLVNRAKKDSILKLKRAENKKNRIAKRELRRIKNIRPYDALAPSKAAFYSAVLPGLGQIYTKKYWKLPIVYGGLGTSVGIALWNANRLEEVRSAFRNRLRGIRNDRFTRVSDDALADAQQTFRRQQELSILFSVGIYVLNIIDANVTAHLQQYNLNENLTLAPKVNIDHTQEIPNLNYGVSLKYSF